MTRWRIIAAFLGVLVIAEIVAIILVVEASPDSNVPQSSGQSRVVLGNARIFHAVEVGGYEQRTPYTLAPTPTLPPGPPPASRPCVASDFTGQGRRFQKDVKDIIGAFSLTNESSDACLIGGFPSISGVAADGALVPLENIDGCELRRDRICERFSQKHEFSVYPSSEDNPSAAHGVSVPVSLLRYEPGFYRCDEGPVSITSFRVSWSTESVDIPFAIELCAPRLVMYSFQPVKAFD